MTVERFTVAASPTSPSLFAVITSRASRKFKRPPIMSSGKLWRCSRMAKLELYGTASCPYTEELREWLEWTRKQFIEYDIDTDAEARERLRSLDSSLLTVPILVEDGKVIQVGWHGRGCIVSAGS